MVSRVVPAISLTIVRSCPINAFSSEDFEPWLLQMNAKDYNYWQDPVQDKKLAQLPAPTAHMEDLFEKFSFMRNNLNLRGTFSQYTKTHDLNAEFNAMTKSLAEISKGISKSNDSFRSDISNTIIAFFVSIVFSKFIS